MAERSTEDPGSELPGTDDSGDDRSAYTPPKLSQNRMAPLEDTREWLFLTENRFVLAGGFLVAVFALLLGVELATSFTDQGLGPLFYVFGSLIGGNFTLVTIVISVSQLVISQQLGSPGELRQRIEETNQYREAVEERMDGDVAPVTPTDFLELLLQQTKTQVDVVTNELDEMDPSEARDDLQAMATSLRNHIDHVTTLLERPEVGIFEALSVTLQTNYSREIYEIRRLEGNITGGSPAALRDSLDDIVVRLEQIDVARQYLKTLYMQDELAKLSRYLLYTGVPAVLSAILMMHQFAASSEAVLSPTTLSALVPLALTVGVAPLAVLLSFVLRISTVSQRTVAVTPFTTPSQEAKGDADHDAGAFAVGSSRSEGSGDG